MDSVSKVLVAAQAPQIVLLAAQRACETQHVVQAHLLHALSVVSHRRCRTVAAKISYRTLGNVLFVRLGLGSNSRRREEGDGERSNELHGAGAEKMDVVEVRWGIGDDANTNN